MEEEAAARFRLSEGTSSSSLTVASEPLGLAVYLIFFLCLDKLFYSGKARTFLKFDSGCSHNGRVLHSHVLAFLGTLTIVARHAQHLSSQVYTITLKERMVKAIRSSARSKSCKAPAIEFSHKGSVLAILEGLSNNQIDKLVGLYNDKGSSIR